MNSGYQDGIQIISQKTKLEWSQESAQEGYRSGIGTRSVVIIQWEVYQGGGWEVWKLSQYQKSLRHNCKTNEVDIIRVNY